MINTRTRAVAMLLLLAAAITPVRGQDSDLYRALATSTWEDRSAYEVLRTKLGAAGNSQVKAIESGLVRVISDPSAGQPGKQAACRLLWMVGGAGSVPALANLLASPTTSDMARYALEGIAGEAAGAALRRAAASADSRNLPAILGSIARRGEPASVGLLARYARSADPAVSWAALHGLGKMGIHAVSALRSMPKANVAAGNALLQIAQGLGGKPVVVPILEEMAQPGRPREVRAPAIAMLAIQNGRPVDRWARLGVTSADTEISERVAVAVVSSGSPASVALIRSAWPRISPHGRSVALTCAGLRRDRAYEPMVLAGLAERNEAVASAAMSAASRIGGLRCCGALIKELASGRSGAGDALAAMPGEGVDAALCRAAGTGAPSLRSKVLGVLAERPSTTALATLLQSAASPEPVVALASLKGLEKSGTAAQYSAVLALCCTAPRGEIGEAAQAATVAIAQRADRSTSITLAVKRFDDGTPDDQLALAGVLAELGGDAALTSLKRAATSADGGVRTAAISAMADKWETTDALAPLLEAATKSPDALSKTRAVRGYLRIVRDADRSPDQDRAERIARVLDLAIRAEDKRSALAVLRQCRVQRSVELAAGLLGVDGLAADAAEAVLYLAEPQKSGDRSLVAVSGPVVKHALELIASSQLEETLKSRAARIPR